MSIARFENVTINNVTNGVDDLGQYTTTITAWFETRATVRDVRNSLRIADRYRAYQDMVNLTFNYTPNMKAVVDEQELYSLTWRGQDWRITEAIESDDRMRVTLLCYYNQPSTPV
jgi:hypothetical protein